MSIKPGFSKDEEQLLKQIAASVIPPSPERSLPGADDEEVFQRLYSNTTDALNSLLNAFHELLESEAGTSAASHWKAEKFNDWISNQIESWPAQSHVFFKLFFPLIIRAYYKDERVHKAYNRRPGPPFPEGYELSDEDWGLLEEVRGRPSLYKSCD